ncbi:N-acetylmuramic acid 6-phosphate etherase [Devosia submarina]|uniref:N-acetylmuramic acid 6-phosphate etherase n=1 Tax=Devosia submarina TaxID=1173082 RepID=UPI000D397E2C|nr:N-acetylmuramic acid 6-phosphate etherase [Devosia submarina]
MTPRQTEMRHSRAQGFDLLAPEEALMILAQAQAAAADTVQTAVPQIAQAADVMAQTISGTGRIIYAAAGSSGLMAMADALELPGTFGIDRSRIKILFAGGLNALAALEGGPEDDIEAARRDVEQAGVGPGDCLLALTASGSTPYPLMAAETARRAGARTIGISTNADVPLFKKVDIAICLPTPPEVIAGATRMGAGTAQKIALNMMSTLMAVRLGHVHDGFMVNVVADNIKLRQRAQGIVAAISGVDEAAASEALDATGGAVKLAVLIAAGAASVEDARGMLNQSGGQLRPALDALARLA